MFIAQIPLYGLLADSMVPALAGTLLVSMLIGFYSMPLIIWTTFGFAVLLGFGAPAWIFGLAAVIAVVFNFPVLRQSCVSKFAMIGMKKMGFLPTISATERTALEAGVVWVEGDLFSGKPDFKKIRREVFPKLTAEEEAFLNGPVNELCSLCDDWSIWKNKEIPRSVWETLKKNRFFGIIIPKEYGGLGFSAYAHGEIVMKVSSRSIPVGITTMVPNSLGPAELLIHYGTEEQKKYYLPRLASGEDVPCFALTEPTAGSDAGAIQAEGVLFKGSDGKNYIRLNWNKRWITLAAVSTLLGMAFRLRDPDAILGKGEDLGITCGLIPSTTPGVVIGRRHDPLGVPFYNCPTQGEDVVVPIDAIIGGINGAGKGWHMLMDCLSAGRGVSIPSQAVGSLKVIARVTSAHAAIRKQFGVAIGKFEGVEEPLARISGYNYLLDAMRTLTLSALDQGIKPPVITAIAKYYSTELGRKAVMDAMDIMGGAGISRGPRNLISNLYISAPIGITVEGANILTRTLMIFGQGALRAHPFAYQELKSLEEGNVVNFDRAFWGHIGHVVDNICRAVLLGLTRGRLASRPTTGPIGRYYQKLAWVSASFAILADVAMGTLGGRLKFKEKITGRFADVLAWMYMIFAVLRRYEIEGCRKEDLPIVQYNVQTGLGEIQKAFDGILTNLRVPGMKWLIQGVIRSWFRINTMGEDVTDRLSQTVAAAILANEEQRERLTQGVYIPSDRNEQLARLEHAYKVVKRAEEAERKVRRAVRKKKLPKKRTILLLDEALSAGIINQEEFRHLKEGESVRLDAIQVDDFSEDEYHGSEISRESPGTAHQVV